MGEQLPLFAARPTARVETSALPLLALTMWQPWAHAVVHGSKRVENRPWKPYPAVLGQHIALHASDVIEPGVLARLNVRFGYAWTERDLARKAIVGVVRVTGFVLTSEDPWWHAGQVGWTLDDVVAIEPVPIARGYHKLWPLPAEIAAEVRCRAAEARGRRG